MWKWTSLLAGLCLFACNKASVKPAQSVSDVPPPIIDSQTPARGALKNVAYAVDGNPCELEQTIVANADGFFKTSTLVSKTPEWPDHSFVCEYSPLDGFVDYKETLHSYSYLLTGPKSGYFKLFGIDGYFVCEDCDMSLTAYGCMTLEVSEADILDIIRQSPLMPGEAWHYDHVAAPCHHDGKIEFQGKLRDYSYYPTGYMTLEGFDGWLMCYDCTVHPEWVAFDGPDEQSTRGTERKEMYKDRIIEAIPSTE